MGERVSAEQLYRISKSDLDSAVDAIRKKTVDHDFEDSTRFDLLVDGRRYPPKAIVGVAAKRAFGRVLSHREFSGGELSSAFRLLWNHGFDVVTKSREVGSLAATFSVGRDRERLFLIFESAGEGKKRNKDYNSGLAALLDHLGKLRARLVDGIVDSRDTRLVPYQERRLQLGDHSYPVFLESVDPGDLQRSIATAAAAVGRKPGAKGAGNRQKRLRLYLDVPEPESLWELQEILGSGGSRVHPPGFGELIFKPGPPPKELGTLAREATKTTKARDLHRQIHVALYEQLKNKHGAESVACECMTSSGNPADIVVKAEDGYRVFEIKTATSASGCIREGLGQLLEYAYWPGGSAVSEIWIVGPVELDERAELYLSNLREQFSLPIRYLCQRLS